MTIPMGEVQMTEQVMLTALRQHHRYADLLVYAQELNDFINECKRDEEWHGNNYDLVKHNCSKLTPQGPATAASARALTTALPC